MDSISIIILVILLVGSLVGVYLYTTNKQSTTKPSVAVPDTTEPAATPETIEPTVEPETIEPIVEPETTEPDAVPKTTTPSTVTTPTATTTPAAPSAPAVPAVPQQQTAYIPPPPSRTDTLLSIVDSLNNPGFFAGIGIDIAVNIGVEIEKYLLKDMIKKSAPAKAAKSRSLLKTFSTRMKKVWTKMSSKMMSRLGMRFTKSSINKFGTSAATRIGERMGPSVAERVGTMAARRLATMATVDAAATATAGPVGAAIGAVYDAVSLTGMVIDIGNIGNFADLEQTSDLLRIKKEIDDKYRNSFIACTSVPLGTDCERSPDAPPDTPDPDVPAKPGRYPQFVGPLDSIALEAGDEFGNLLDSNVLTLMTTQPYSTKVQGFIDRIKQQYHDDFVSALQTRNMTPDQVQTLWDSQPPWTAEDLSSIAQGYWTVDEIVMLYDQALSLMCTNAGGVSFMPGPGYDRACTFLGKNSCHAAYPWPAPLDVSKDLQYTEWRSKGWFGQFKNVDGSNTIDMSAIPEDGACIAASSDLHLQCDEPIKVGTRSAKNIYNRETGECYNSQELCNIKGVSYKTDMQPSEMANLTDHQLPSCYKTTAQSVCENAVSGTICGVLQSQQDLQFAQQGLNNQLTASDIMGAGTSVINHVLTGVGVPSGVVNTIDQIINNPVSSAIVNNPVISAVTAPFLQTSVTSLSATYIAAHDTAQQFGQLVSGDAMTPAQAQQNILDQVATSRNTLTSIANNVDDNPLLVATLPVAAITSGVAILAATVNSAFGALEGALGLQKPSCPNPPKISCSNGFTAQSIYNNGCIRGWECKCPGGNVSNNICCPQLYTGMMRGVDPVCVPWQYPSWWKTDSFCGNTHLKFRDDPAQWIIQGGYNPQDPRTPGGSDSDGSLRKYNSYAQYCNPSSLRTPCQDWADQKESDDNALANAMSMQDANADAAYQSNFQDTNWYTSQ